MERLSAAPTSSSTILTGYAFKRMTVKTVLRQKLRKNHALCPYPRCFAANEVAAEAKIHQNNIAIQTTALTFDSGMRGSIAAGGSH
jgi:hypothetical protein